MYRKKKIQNKHTDLILKLFLFVISLCLLVNCTGKTVSDKNDNSSATVWNTILFCKYLVFSPSDFTDFYSNGASFQEGINYWVQLDYQNAEHLFLNLENEMKANGVKYPEDIAFVQLAIGTLYIDMAKYNSAYEYLISSYSSFREIFNRNSGQYENAASLSLAYYYYAIGNYDSCLKEINSLKTFYERLIEDTREPELVEGLSFFFSYAIDSLEAQIRQDRNDLDGAFSLFDKIITEAKEQNSNDSPNSKFTQLMRINALIHIGDLFYLGSNLYEGVTKTIGVYDYVLKILDKYPEDIYAKSLKAEVMAKKAYYFGSISEDNFDDAIKLIDEAISIQESINEKNKVYAGLANTYIYYGDMYGYIKKDFDRALLYYSKALEISEEAYGHNHPQTAKIYETEARFYGNRLLDFEKALEIYKEGLEICNNTLMENTLLAADIQLNMAGCYRLLDDEESYKEYIENANKIYDRLGVHLEKSS